MNEAVETQEIPMYTAIHHDSFNDLIFIWYADGRKDGFRVKHRSYTPSRGQYGSVPSNMVDIYKNPLNEIIVSGKQEKEIRADNTNAYNTIAECDIDFRTRWLENHYKDQQDIKVDVSKVNICFLDIEVATLDRFPAADKAERPVNCVTIYFSRLKKYYTYGLNRPLKPEMEQQLKDNGCTYINCPSEKALLTQLFTAIAENDTDVLTGWNSEFFDIPYLVNRARQMSVSLKLLSRLPEKYKTAYISKRDNSLKVGGMEIMDFLLLYKKLNFNERDDYKLDTIGYVETGERKAPLPDGYKSYINYWDDFVWYNFKDTQLMVNIEEACKLFDTTFHACTEARVPYSAIFETKKMEVGFILKYLHNRNIAMPPLRERGRKSFPGAYVYAKPNYYTYLVSYDYGSMYPSFMMGANISPEVKVIKQGGKFYDANNIELPGIKQEELVISPYKPPSGDYEIFYRKDVIGIIPSVTRELFDGRKAHKKTQQNYEREGKLDLAGIFEMKQKTYKIFGNGLYGLLGNPYFQFYDIDNSATITSFGVELITYTIEKLCHYFENGFKEDSRFIETFGMKPHIDDRLEGYVEEIDENGRTNRHYNRLSHGDTDSFFVKYNDIYAPFVDKAGKEVEVVVIEGNKVIYKKSYDLATEEKKSKIDFNNKLNEFCLSWKDIPDVDEEKVDKKKVFQDGMFREGEYRVIYNRWCLTDFCRILDAVLMEDVLSGLMQDFADKWNFMENTLVLKREKCITQAIVTAKKKYICNVESNEDIKIYDPDKRFKVTGLEIVRSSTTPFAREFVLSCVKELLNTMDKKHIRENYLKIKSDFFKLAEQGKVYDLAIPSGIKEDPPEYEEMLEWDDEEKKKVDWRRRAASAWNHLIKVDEVLNKELLEPAYGGSKVKFLKVAHNRYGLNTIGFIGTECPPRILEEFNVDWQEQWKTGFANVMLRLFDAIGWGDVEHDERELMMEIL